MCFYSQTNRWQMIKSNPGSNDRFDNSCLLTLFLMSTFKPMCRQHKINDSYSLGWPSTHFSSLGTKCNLNLCVVCKLTMSKLANCFKVMLFVFVTVMMYFPKNNYMSFSYLLCRLLSL